MTVKTPRVVKWAARVFGREVADRVFAPLEADRQCAIHHSKSHAAYLATSARWLAAIAWTAAGTAWHYGVRSDDRREWMRIAGPAVALGTTGTLALVLPFARWGWERPDALHLMLLIVPQALGISLPFTMVPAAMRMGAAVGPGDAAPRRRPLVALVAATVIATALTTGWIVPAANGAWRDGMAGHALRPGLRELTAPELAFGDAFARNEAQRELRTRALISLAWPPALAALGWHIGRRRRAAGPLAMTVCWVAAGLVLGAVDPSRHLAQELPTALAPAVWLVVALLFGTRTRNAET